MENQNEVTVSRHVFPDELPPSNEQWALYDKALSAGENLTVNAVAGSGKTTALGGLARRLGLNKEELLAIAFSKHNAKTFEVKVPQATSSTIHALSYRTAKNTWRYLRFGKDSVDSTGFKMKDIAKELRLDTKYPSYQDWEVRGMLSDVVHFCMVSMTPPIGSAIEEMADKFTIRLPGDADEVASDVEQIILRARQMFFNSQGTPFLNFDEMIYWPTVEGIKPEPFHTVMVDEVQDLNILQRQFVSLIPKERVIGVGDPNQAIMMFAGAENDAARQFTETFNATEMPLSCSFRCAQNIVRHAQKIVPRITYPEWAIEGSVDEIRKHKLLDSLKLHHQSGEDTFIVCRINAPLISLCFGLINSGVRAKIRGRDTGRALCGLVRQVMGKDSNNMSDFPIRLEKWAEKERVRIFRTGGRRAEALVGAINDKADCLSNFYDNLEPSTVDQMCAGINALFTDDTLPGVNLMSCHGSKGLEAKTVFVLNPEKLPLQWTGQSEAQYQQESNLDYVARTRAMQKLIYIRE